MLLTNRSIDNYLTYKANTSLKTLLNDDGYVYGINLSSYGVNDQTNDISKLSLSQNLNSDYTSTRHSM